MLPPEWAPVRQDLHASVSVSETPSRFPRSGPLRGGGAGPSCSQLVARGSLWKCWWLEKGRGSLHARQLPPTAGRELERGQTKCFYRQCRHHQHHWCCCCCCGRRPPLDRLFVLVHWSELRGATAALVLCSLWSDLYVLQCWLTDAHWALFDLSAHSFFNKCRML